MSAWLTFDRGLAVSSVQIGPWVIWTDAADPQADPYTRANTARSGRLLISGASARYYLAKEDSDGRRLRASCEYAVDGRAVDALWWSLAVYDENGGIFPNKAGRHAFNSTNIFLREDDTFTVALSKNARPGNWLPVAGDSTFRLILRVHWPATTESSAGVPLHGQGLPTITRVNCE
jgi:hypothetical protein